MKYEEQLIEIHEYLAAILIILKSNFSETITEYRPVPDSYNSQSVQYFVQNQ